MCRALLAAISICFLFTEIAYAQLNLPLNPELIGHNLPPSYLTISPEPGNSRNYRQLKLLAPLIGEDGVNQYSIGLGIVPINSGGTGATKREVAVNNLLHYDGLIGGSLLYCDEYLRWHPLAPGHDGQALSLASGKPVWSSAVVSIPKTASVLTLHESLIDYPNSRQLQADPGAGIAIVDTGGQLKLSADSSVLRTNKPQIAAGPLSLSNGPTIIGAQAQGLNLEGSAHTVNLSIADVAHDYHYVFPDSGNDAAVVMSEGEQVINGDKVFSNLWVAGQSLGTDKYIQTFPAKSSTIVNCDSEQTLQNKNFNGIVINETAPYLELDASGGRHYRIDWDNLSDNRHYSFYDANADGDVAIKSGPINPGGVCFGDGNVLRCTATGSVGLPLLSQAQAAPVFDVLKQNGGGTGMIAYKPGDLLIAGADGKLTVIPIGKPGQTLTVNAQGNGVNWK